MNLLARLFPFHSALPEIEKAPPGSLWHDVHPRPCAATVKARIAEADGDIKSARGVLHYRRHRDYLVEHASGDVAVIDRDTFKRTYRLRDDGQFQRRENLTFRYFQLPYAVMVRTAEGPQRAAANDWILEGLHGEIWPVRAENARNLYIAA